MNSSSSSRRRRIAHSAAKVMYMNAAYFPNMRIRQGDSPGQLNYSCINHLYYAYANVAPDGSVVLSDEWADLQAPLDGVSGGVGSLMQLKQRHPHLQVVLSVGGEATSEMFPHVASNEMLRDNFARTAKALVDASGFDGIDIAWEYPRNPQEGHDLLALLAAVRMYLPEDRYFLTAALPAMKVMLQLIDLASAARFLDFINLMAYDFFGPWSPKSGHHSQLYSMNKDEPSAASAVTYLMSQGFPAKKILLGIATYGRSFLGSSGPGQKFKGAGGDEGMIDYNQLPRKHSKEVVDKRNVAAQCIGGDAGFVTYDNPDTVKTKAAFCKQKGLGGLFYWNAPADVADRSRSLIAAGFGALHSS